jgi:hypothetical protein
MVRTVFSGGRVGRNVVRKASHYVRSEFYQDRIWCGLCSAVHLVSKQHRFALYGKIISDDIINNKARKRY